MVPQLRAWHERYADQGRRVVGVDTPEFSWEKPFDSVVKATKKLGVRYPVVQDNESTVWRRFGVWAWPTAVLIDKRGVVRYRHIGEGGYAETEALIRRLLAEDG